MNRAERRAAVSFHRAQPKRDPWAWEDVEITESHRIRFPACRECLWFKQNKFYQVQAYRIHSEWGPVLHLAVRHVSGNPFPATWQLLERIKQELAGDVLAVQVHPRASAMVDQANLYHLWCLPDDCELPFGLHLPGGGLL